MQCTPTLHPAFFIVFLKNVAVEICKIVISNSQVTKFNKYKKR